MSAFRALRIKPFCTKAIAAEDYLVGVFVVNCCCLRIDFDKIV